MIIADHCAVSAPAARKPSANLTFVALLVALFAPPSVSAADWRFSVRFLESLHQKPFTGRVYIFSSDKPQEPRTALNWFQPEPFCSLDVTDWTPDSPLTIAADTPALLSFPAGKPFQPHRRVQAVVRFNPWERQVGTGVGNGYSTVMELPESPPSEPIPLSIERLVEDPPFPESSWLQLCEVRSEALSRFHQRDVAVRASVLLPASYVDQPDRRYPAIFAIPGFGGTHRLGLPQAPIQEDNPGGVEFVRVILDPSCPWGHHVFADSANNGPWGAALVADWFPEFERRFRTVAAPHARFVTGHSSGGWSSLWVQITHPDVFGGVWSTAPDPIDFRDFSRINIYRTGENAYRDLFGQRRPIARKGEDEVRLWLDDFDHMETVLGPGGQLQSFEAVFSPRGDRHLPRPLWDRRSGVIDLITVRAWEAYDINLVLSRDWATLGPKLRGKLHIFMGDQDTFYLEGATKLVAETLKELGSDAVVELHPGKDHGSLMTQDLRNRLRREMAETYLRGAQ